MCYTVENLNEIAPWLLGWGKSAKVISPNTLKTLLKYELETMLRELEA
jgi:predicted DNA-binding transcriptional regulator YafY